MSKGSFAVLALVLVSAPLWVGCGGSSPSDDTPPDPPLALQRWLTGSPADARVSPHAGIVLMGGGTDVDAAFVWQRDRIAGGDVVVLRASGADGYNDYLYGDIGGVDSVETLLIDERALADDPYVVWAIDHAEAIFLAGGDQAVYLATWTGTATQAALRRVWQRGAVIGGTSAGAAVLGAIVYSAEAGSVYSDEALADPFDAHVTLTRDFVALPPLASAVTDTHFGARDRMGRLLAFLARVYTANWTQTPLGIGVDEETAVVIDEASVARVLGAGAIYVIAPTAAPMRCVAGEPLAWSNVPVFTLRDGDTWTLPRTSLTAPRSLSSDGGALSPSDPY